MKIIGLDCSTKTGYAVIDNGKLTEYGLIKSDDFPNEFMEDIKLLKRAEFQAMEMAALLEKINPDLIVIEQTNAGKFRTSQKQLEFIHCLLLVACSDIGVIEKIRYVDTSAWRRGLNIKLDADQRIHNKQVKQGAVRGKITPKHLAVAYVNQEFNLKLKLKDNDIADALCLARYGQGLFKQKTIIIPEKVDFNSAFQFH